MRKILLMAVSLWSACPAIAAENSNFTFDVSFGPHAVGFRVVQQYDYSRAYKRSVDAEGKPETRERARPIQTLIWYPAEPDKNANAMLYGSYLDLLATEDDFTSDERRRANKLMTNLERRGLMDNYERERVQVTKAFRDARAKLGHFPVVIYAPSFSAPAFENSDLCEYLASHGYIVVASPDMGSHSRGMTLDLEGIETQIGDIGFLIGYLQKIPEADSSRIAVAGFSWGGLSNVFARIKDDRISAVVSLDGTIRYATDLIKEAKFVSPSKFTAPFLFLASRNVSLEQLNRFKVDTSYNFLNELKYSDFYLTNFTGMAHQDFSSYFIRFRKEADFKEYTAADICQSHGWMARYILEFLNAYLRNDPAALEFLKNEPAKNSVPRHLVAVDFREALRPAPNVADFAREMARLDFDKATEIYEEARKRDPAFTLEQAEVNSWGYELLGSDRVPQAIAVFKLNVSIYPERWNAYDSLAEAQAAAGDKESAIANYKKSLQLNGGNTNAVERLKKLEASTGR